MDTVVVDIHTMQARQRSRGDVKLCEAKPRIHPLVTGDTNARMLVHLHSTRQKNRDMWHPLPKTATAIEGGREGAGRRGGQRTARERKLGITCVGRKSIPDIQRLLYTRICLRASLLCGWSASQSASQPASGRGGRNGGKNDM